MAGRLEHDFLIVKGGNGRYLVTRRTVEREVVITDWEIVDDFACKGAAEANIELRKNEGG